MLPRFEVGDRVVDNSTVTPRSPPGVVVEVRSKDGYVVIEHDDGDRTPFTHPGWWRLETDAERAARYASTEATRAAEREREAALVREVRERILSMLSEGPASQRAILAALDDPSAVNLLSDLVREKLIVAMPIGRGLTAYYLPSRPLIPEAPPSTLWDVVLVDVGPDREGVIGAIQAMGGDRGGAERTIVDLPRAVSIAQRADAAADAWKRLAVEGATARVRRSVIEPSAAGASPPAVSPGFAVRIPPPRPASREDEEDAARVVDAATASPAAAIADLRAKRQRADQLSEGRAAAVALEKLAQDIEDGDAPPVERFERASGLLAEAEAIDAQRREHLLRFLREKVAAAWALGSDGKTLGAALGRLLNRIEREQAPARQRSELLRTTSAKLQGEVGAFRMFGVARGGRVDLQEQYGVWSRAEGNAEAAPVPSSRQQDRAPASGLSELLADAQTALAAEPAPAAPAGIPTAEDAAAVVEHRAEALSQGLEAKTPCATEEGVLAATLGEYRTLEEIATMLGCDVEAVSELLERLTTAFKLRKTYNEHKPTRWGHDVPPHRDDWTFDRDGERIYVDSDFARAAGRLPGFSVEHVAYGMLTLHTPAGDIQLDPTSKTFPGQVGRSHTVFGPPEAMTLLLREMHVDERLAQVAAAPVAAPPVSPKLRALRTLLANDETALEIDRLIDMTAQDDWWKIPQKTRRVYLAVKLALNDSEVLANEVMKIARKHGPGVPKGGASELPAAATPGVPRPGLPLINSVDALKHLPKGTRLYLVDRGRGPQVPSARILEQVRLHEIGLKVEDPTSKSDGQVTWLPLSDETLVVPTDKGFKVLSPDGVGPEFVFEEPAAAGSADAQRDALAQAGKSVRAALEYALAQDPLRTRPPVFHIEARPGMGWWISTSDLDGSERQIGTLFTKSGEAAKVLKHGLADWQEIRRAALERSKAGPAEAAPSAAAPASVSRLAGMLTAAGAAAAGVPSARSGAEPAPSARPLSAEAQSALEERVLEATLDAPRSSAELAERLGTAVEAVRKAARALVSRGRVKLVSGGGREPDRWVNTAMGSSAATPDVRAPASATPGEARTLTPEALASVAAAIGAGPLPLDTAKTLERVYTEGTPEEHRQKQARREANLAAMWLAYELNKNPRPPTDAELLTLGAYSGWGGLGEKKGRRHTFAEFVQRMPPGMQAEERGLIHEYYTPSLVCSEVGRVLQPYFPALATIGNGTIDALEPSAGVGRFPRTMEGPGYEQLRWHAVEFSHVSAAILRAMRPKLDLFEGPFEQWVTENQDQWRGRLGLVISNPPYGVRGEAAHEDTSADYAGYKESWQYFLRRALDLLAKDGIGVFLIPSGFMTGAGATDLRATVLLRHHLMCAFRLPSNLFPQALVTVDLIFFRSRGGVLQSRDGKSSAIDDADQSIVEGNYFVENPSHVLGTVKPNGRYGGGYEIVGEFQGLPAFRERPICAGCVHAPLLPAEPPAPRPKSLAATLVGSVARLKLASALGTRLATFLEGVSAQKSETPFLAWRELHDALTAWSKTYGPPSEDKGLQKLATEGNDPGAQKFLTGYERGSTNLVQALRTPPKWEPTYTGPEDDPVAWSTHLYKQHRVLHASEVEDDLQALFDAGWCEDRPGELVPPEDYFAGDLWDKHDRAKERADAGDEQAADQVARLLDVIKPAFFDDITKDSFSPQQAWIPLQLVECWIETLAKVGTVRLERVDGLVKEVGKDYEDIEGGWQDDVGNVLGWINHDRSLFRPQKKNKDDNIDNIRVEQADAWNKSFKAWCSATEGRKQIIERAYQRAFQGYKPKRYAIDPLPLARWGNRVTLRPHQNAGARRVVANRGGLVAFDVGVGKTYTGAAILAAARQEGWAKRPVIVVPNSIVWNWVAELALALPDYRVGVIGANRKVISTGRNTGKHTSETDTPEERAEKWTRFQAGEFDVMLVTYSSFIRTKMSRGTSSTTSSRPPRSSGIWCSAAGTPRSTPAAPAVRTPRSAARSAPAARSRLTRRMRTSAATTA